MGVHQSVIQGSKATAGAPERLSRRNGRSSRVRWNFDRLDYLDCGFGFHVTMSDLGHIPKSRVGLHEVIIITLVDNLASFEHENDVTRLHGGDAVCNHYDRFFMS